MNIFENAKFGEMYETENGRNTVYCGALPNNDKKDIKYYIFMFESAYEIELYDETGFGPYGFSVGSGSIFKPYKIDKIIKKYI